MDNCSPAKKDGEEATEIFPGEIKPDISVAVTAPVIYACQLSPSMALFTLESRGDLDEENKRGGAAPFAFDYLWNDGNGTPKDQNENLRYLDVIVKRNDSWETDQISAMYKLLEDTLAEEQEHVSSCHQDEKPRMKIRVQGWPERMRPKFPGDSAPICLHAQTIQFGDKSVLFQATKSESFDKMAETVPKEKKPPTKASAPRENKGKHGGADDNTRFSKFVHFLLSEFGGYETLSQKPVLDIAGGAGGLAFELSMRHEIEAIVVDTKEVKLKGQHIRHLKFRKHCLEQLAKDPYGTAHTSLLKKNLQNRFRTRDFAQLNTLLDGSCILSSHGDGGLVFHGAPDGEAQQQLHAILKSRECSVMVGLHPDQALDPIVDIGLSLGIPWAVVPCCVFPNLFQQRQLASGRPVRNYEDLCEYILQRDPTIQRATLPCRGRNTVFYWRPPVSSID